MKFLNTPEFKVGVFVLAISGLIAVMSMQVSDNPTTIGPSRTLWMELRDATGLVKRGNVRMAGIDVGVVDDIKLRDGKARVTIVVRRDVNLTSSTKASVRSNGILGDRYIELTAGDPKDPLLGEGEQIKNTDDAGSMDTVFNDIGKITKSLSEVADNLKIATSGKGDTTAPLGRIIHNIETLTGDLAEISNAKKEEINEIVDNIHSITGSLSDLLQDNEDGGLRSAIQGVTQSMGRVERSLKNVEEITEKINSGKGTIGKLVNDDTTIEEINSAISGVNSYLDTASRLETDIDFNSAMIVDQKVFKSLIGLRIQPGLDRYYEVQVIGDPTVNGVAPTGPNATTQTKLSALFAKNYYDFTIKGGLIESGGGFGLDYYVLRRKLRISFEVFDLSQTRLRFSSRYSIYNGIYLIGGVENISALSRTNSFIGGGIFITNDDLKLLLSKVF